MAAKINTEQTSRQKKVLDGLANWLSLNSQISSWDEEMVKLAIRTEEQRPGGPRRTIMRRLKQRLNGLRIAAVRSEV